MAADIDRPPPPVEGVFELVVVMWPKSMPYVVVCCWGLKLVRSTDDEIPPNEELVLLAAPPPLDMLCVDVVVMVVVPVVVPVKSL